MIVTHSVRSMDSVLIFDPIQCFEYFFYDINIIDMIYNMTITQK